MASVLLAIHDPACRRALHDALSADRYDPRPAATLAQALDLSGAHRIDVAIIDAGFDGYGLLTDALKRRQPEPRPLVVRLTGEMPAPASLGRPDAALSKRLPAPEAIAFLDRLVLQAPRRIPA